MESSSIGFSLTVVDKHLLADRVDNVFANLILLIALAYC